MDHMAGEILGHRDLKLVLNVDARLKIMETVNGIDLVSPIQHNVVAHDQTNGNSHYYSHVY